MDTFTVDDCAIGTIRELIDQTASTRGEQVFLIREEIGRALTFMGLRQSAKVLMSLGRATTVGNAGSVHIMPIEIRFLLRLMRSDSIA
jgi:hypothetical protein